MPEIAAVRGTNGLTAASTFAGCGGSCLGLEMAGFNVVWANEFVPAAADTYRENHPHVFLNVQDIREISPADVLREAGISEGDLDLLNGSPPCASFSTSGKRSTAWGKVKKYSDVEQRTDDLFFEFARILEGVRPRAFVAENVSGLVKGVAKGYFLEILKRLKGCGYKVEARLLDAQWLGVPQMRRRLIFVGVREDVPGAPKFPSPCRYRYSIKDAIGSARITGASYGRNLTFEEEEVCPTVMAVGIAGAARHQIFVETSMEGYAVGDEWSKLRPGQTSDRYFNLSRPDPDRPCPTVTAIGGSNPGIASVCHPSEKRKFTIAELKRLCGFPDDFILTGSYAQQWERLGRAVPPPMMMAVAREVSKVLSGEST